MRRREFASGLASLAVVGSVAGTAEGQRKRFLVAMLTLGYARATERHRRGFVARLHELGYVEGRDYAIEARFADTVVSRLPALAEELVRLKPNVIVAAATPAVAAARNATAEIPIISPVFVEPVALGLAATQARPKGNVTGILANTDELVGKRVSLAGELVPGAAKIGLLLNPSNPATPLTREYSEAAAAALSVELVQVEVRSPAELVEELFTGLARAGAGVVVVSGDSMFVSERRAIAAMALSARLPSVYTFREHVEAGGLMSYGADLAGSYRRAADFVDRIFKGARPADLPIELPTAFELVINLKTAQALGLAIPPLLLGRADEVIE